MYLRFTPALALSVFLTSVLALWATADVANDDFTPTMLSNWVTAAWLGSVLYWASGLRREKGTPAQVAETEDQADEVHDKHEADERIRQLRSR